VAISAAAAMTDRFAGERGIAERYEAMRALLEQQEADEQSGQ
jgi:hypothetical protein